MYTSIAVVGRAQVATVIHYLIQLITCCFVWLTTFQATFYSVHPPTRLCIFEDNEAVIRMIITGRCANFRHVSRNHSVDMRWQLERISLDSSIPFDLCVLAGRTCLMFM